MTSFNLPAGRRHPAQTQAARYFNNKRRIARQGGGDGPDISVPLTVENGNGGSSGGTSVIDTSAVPMGPDRLLIAQVTIGDMVPLTITGMDSGDAPELVWHKYAEMVILDPAGYTTRQELWWTYRAATNAHNVQARAQFSGIAAVSSIIAWSVVGAANFDDPWDGLPVVATNPTDVASVMHAALTTKSANSLVLNSFFAMDDTDRQDTGLPAGWTQLGNARFRNGPAGHTGFNYETFTAKQTAIDVTTGNAHTRWGVLAAALRG